MNWPAPDDYQAARPFPHAVIDGFISPEWAEQVAAEFPPCDAVPIEDEDGERVTYSQTIAHDPRWHHFASPVEDKWQCSDPDAWGANTKRLHRWLTHPGFADKLGVLVGTDNLRASTFGGGYHLIRPGGFLGMHTDSLHDPYESGRWEPNWYRCVNLLVFLTDNRDETACLNLRSPGTFTALVEPRPGRAVIFTTTGNTLHGHPEPLRGTYGDRRSFAAYYYRREPPPWWTGDQPTTFVGAEQ